MKRFIAYFDYMGFKDFILENDDEIIKRHTSFLLRDMEICLGQGSYRQSRSGNLVADLTNATVNCLNISDTAIFWTKDGTLKSLHELLKVAYEFNWREVCYTMPVRGVISYIEMEMWNGKSENNNGVVYSANMMHGKGIVQAHIKSESLNWAGTVIDDTVIAKIHETDDPQTFLKDFAKKYDVPYKSAPLYRNEFALLLTKPLNQQSFKNTCDSIDRSFKGYRQILSNPRALELKKNTIAFLETFLVTEE